MSRLLRAAWILTAAASFSPRLDVAAAAAAPALVTTERDLLAALRAPTPHVRLSAALVLSATLHLPPRATLIGSPGASLELAAGAAGPVVRIAGAADVTLRDLRVAYPAGASWRAQPAALLVEGGATRVALAGLVVEGGVALAGGVGITLSWSDISNARGAQNGTCVYVPGCGDSKSLTPCALEIHDNEIHDCRYDGVSIYDGAAQGVLLGAQAGAPPSTPNGGCTVGVLVRNNYVRRVDEMGIRVATDAECATVNNNVSYNRVAEWGQGSKAVGGDGADSGCLYVYGHWHAPGNLFLANFCNSSANLTWGQNGAYLDDSASGNAYVGNFFEGARDGVAVKLNGGQFNVVDSNVVYRGASLGAANCRGVRPPENYIYTCENANTGARWLKVLQAVDYLNPPWSLAFPWYRGFCSNVTAGPHDTPCRPPGAPAGYECASLSRGNVARNFATVAAVRNTTFLVPTSPGFPYLNWSSACPEFVVTGGFNNIDPASQFAYASDDVFVDAAGGDLTLRADAPIFADMPTFLRINFTAIGVGGAGPRKYTTES